MLSFSVINLFEKPFAVEEIFHKRRAFFMSFFCLGLSLHNSPFLLSSALLAELCDSLEFPARGFRPFSAGNCPLGSFPGAPNPASSHTVGATLPPPFGTDRLFCGYRNTDLITSPKPVFTKNGDHSRY